MELLGSYYNTIIHERKKYYQGSLFDYINGVKDEVDISSASNNLKEFIRENSYGINSSLEYS